MSIREHGFYGTVIAQRSTGHILAGNHRFQAGCAEGLAEFPVCWVDVDNRQARKILLADNRLSDLAGWDGESVLDMLRGLDGDLAGTGFDFGAMRRMIGQARPAGIADGDGTPVEARPGDRFRVTGEREHRVVCGDASQVDAQPAALIVTDPPYELKAPKLAAVLDRWGERAVMLVSDQQAFRLIGHGWEPRLSLVWRHGSSSVAAASFPVRLHTLVVLAARTGVKLGWARPDPSFASVLEAEYDRSVHAHGQPPGLFADLIRGFRDADTVADPFLGGGASLLAADALGRRMVGVELDPETCAAALGRFAAAGMTVEQMSGGDADAGSGRRKAAKAT